jgi:AcrR family transcriptional regulator
MSPSSANEIPPGLRERKKLKTRAAIQKHAMRLFAEQGYSATTVEQIAEAAEVSPSTFFRYFPAKEDVILFDSTDPLMLDAFEAQPPELSPLEALRRAIREVYGGLAPEEMERERERMALVRTVPEIRTRVLATYAGAIGVVAELVAKRVGRDAGDIRVRTFAGALVGALIGVYLATEDDPDADYITLIDATLAQLEAGLPL